MITSILPASWQDLQKEVALILQECGFDVTIEKKAKLSRGDAELDVYARESIKGRKYTIICECKYWKKKIPQHVIHSFRTVVQDAGANIGYIISMAGFQPGSESAAEFSNIELLTWTEFQQQFFESWYRNYFSPEFTRQTDSFGTYVEPILPKWFDRMPPPDRMQFLALKEHYDILGPIIMDFTTYVDMLKPDREIPRLPLIRAYEGGKYEDLVRKKIPDDILSATTYREFMRSMLRYVNQGLSEFRYFRDKYYLPEEEY